MDSPTITGVTPRAVLSACAAQGKDVRTLLAAAGLLRGVDDSMRVPAGKVFSLWRATGACADNSSIALDAGARVPIGAYRVFDFLVLSSATLEQSLRRVVEYYPLLNEAFRFTRQTRGGQVSLLLHPDSAPEEARQLYVEFIFTVVIRRLEHMLAASLPLQAIHFGFPHRGNAERHTSRWGVPVLFNQRESALVLDGQVLRARSWQADPELAELLEGRAQQALRRGAEESEFPAMVRGCLVERLGAGPLLLGEVARQMAVSRRALQRRLAEEGLTFRKLVDEVRWKRCRELLEQPGMPVEELSCALGFSEPSAFHRAFRRWAGMSPGEYVL